MTVEPEMQEFIRRCLTDTGYTCRNLLGWDYDEDEGGTKLNVGSGGVRDTGSHQRMVELLDSPSKFKLLEAPRGSYKSTILQGFCVRQILANPDVRILYLARTDPMAREKALAVRSALTNDKVTELFGSQIGTPWEATSYTVAGRRQTNLMSPTFSAYSLDSLPTGGRANFVILDDFIDQSNVTNSDQIKKAQKAFEYVQPFIAKGGTIIVVGTRYGESDLYSTIEASPNFAPPNGQQLILGAGVRVIRTDAGHLDIEPTAEGLTFPHQTLDFLRMKLHGMSSKGEFNTFSCQYLNDVPSGMASIFRRHMFRPLPWGPDMETLTGYLLTDTATSTQEEGCHSVVAYAGLDASDNIYLLDLRVGHFTPHEFVNEFFDVLETWQPKLNHAGEVWEDISLATVFNHSINADSRSRKVRVRPIEIKRYTTERKKQRIQRLHTPMYQKQFHVVNTVPRVYTDVDGDRELWNPEGYYDARTRTKMPSGELVDQFIKLGSHGKMDIADTIAMLLECEKKKGTLRRYCTYKPAKPKPKIGLTEQRRIDYHRETYGSPQTGDWWDQVTHDLYNG